MFYPWTDLTAVEETSRAFYVHQRTGVAAVLPKRGLPDTSQIPELRQFLHQALAEHPARPIRRPAPIPQHPRIDLCAPPRDSN